MECEYGDSGLRTADLKFAIKNFNHIERHLEQFYEDQFDFHLYSLRKCNLNAYVNMIDFENNLYRNKFACSAAIGLMRCVSRVNKNLGAEREKFEPVKADYYKSQEYKDLQEELSKFDDDDEYRHDSDPKGYKLYEKTVRLSIDNPA